jgi:hypothetical protein
VLDAVALLTLDLFNLGLTAVLGGMKVRLATSQAAQPSRQARNYVTSAILSLVYRPPMSHSET